MRKRREKNGRNKRKGILVRLIATKNLAKQWTLRHGKDSCDLCQVLRIFCFVFREKERSKIEARKPTFLIGKEIPQKVDSIKIIDICSNDLSIFLLFIPSSFSISSVSSDLWHKAHHSFSCAHASIFWLSSFSFQLHNEKKKCSFKREKMSFIYHANTQPPIYENLLKFCYAF